jgi:hypothetical protein
MTEALVSIETIRQALLRLGVGWQRAKHWITSPDPEYLRKKNDATLSLHWPSGMDGLLAIRMRCGGAG